MMWNVTHGDGKVRMLGVNVGTQQEAEKWAAYYRERYEGKPYPNGKGIYPFKNFRAISCTRS